MDDKEKQLLAQSQADLNPQPLLQSAPGVTPIQTQEGKPEITVPDSAALALLTIDGLQGSHHPQPKFPLKIIIALIGLVILVVVASSLSGTFKSKTGSKSTKATGSGLLKQQNSNNTNDTSTQINQDVQSCSNPVNAISEC